MILKGLCNVDSLVLGRGFIENLSRNGDLLLAYLPSSYCSLKDLHLEMFPTRNHFQVVTLLLRLFPNLENLEIKVFSEEDLASSNMEQSLQWNEIPAGDFLKHLMAVGIKDFEGCQFELDIVR
ncbi:hypothetical protein IFM89_026442 [Coptis chinensis]|uniref:FBD domain-containing protein n=1 Tax=Coptis chinensis TaxID=261450 RepID=A0A835LJH9_9MAGN|nr:hypothetical protein IFM89_026442 [Coptis chinensis]